MPTLVLSESTLDVLARVAVHFLWQGALLGLAAAGLLHVSPIRTARARYAFFCGLLMLLAMCPLATWHKLSREAAVGLDASAAPVDQVSDAAHARPEANGAELAAVLPSDTLLDGASFLDHSLHRPAESRLALMASWLAPMRGLIVSGWLVGICLMATRLLLGAVGVQRLSRRGQPIPRELASLVERLSRRLAFRVQPTVHAAERISQAMAVGIIKPLVLLPAAWISELPSDVLEAVIAHELAHLRRWDLPINLLQRVIESVLFFHPVVWWCSRRMRIEREMCCDELAQAAIGDRMVYAKALAYLAHQQCSAHQALLAAGIGGSKMMVYERIRNVLRLADGRHGRLYGPSCALFGAVVTSLAWIAVVGLPGGRQPESSRPLAEVTIEKPTTAPTEPGATQTNAPDPFDLALEPSDPPSEATDGTKPLTLENLKLQNYRDLTLDETIKTTVANSKVVRSLEEHRRQSAPKDDAGRFELEKRLTDYELAVLNLVADAEAAYWELVFAFRNLETSNTALNSARHTWQIIYAAYRAGNKGGEASAEAQAREQFYQFKSQTQTLLDELSRAENRLRFVMGLAASDGELIRPIDRPKADKVKFDWIRLSHDALAHNPDLRRQRSRVKQQELVLVATTKMLPRELRRKGMPDDSVFQEWALGSQAILPIGLRQKLATLHAQQLKLARERARLQDQELYVSHQMADALRQLEYSYVLSQTNLSRALAADRQAEALQASFDGKSVTLDQVLEAQRRRAEAQTSYYRTLHDYQRAILAVQYRRGSLL